MKKMYRTYRFELILGEGKQDPDPDQFYLDLQGPDPTQNGPDPQPWYR